MIEIRLRAAASNPSSRPWRWGIALAAIALAVIAPAATSRAQDASGTRTKTMVAEVDSVRSSKGVSIEAGRDIVIDAGDTVTIWNGAASITMKKDGTIVLKGTDIVIDGPTRATTRLESTPPPVAVPAPKSRAAQVSEIF